MIKNTGRQPPQTRGKRIRGRFAFGEPFGLQPGPQPGWAADTTRWTLTGHDYDVGEWEIVD